MTPIKIHQTETGFRLASTAWPTILMVSDQVARTGTYVKFSWPYLVLQVENGRAVYRVETCDRGAWMGALVESSIFA